MFVLLYVYTCVCVGHICMHILDIYYIYHVYIYISNVIFMYIHFNATSASICQPKPRLQSPATTSVGCRWATAKLLALLIVCSTVPGYVWNKRAFIKEIHLMLHLHVVHSLKIRGERIDRDFRWRLRSRLRPLLTWRVVFQYAPDSRSWNSKRFCVLSGQSREPTRTWCDERGNLNNDNIQTKQKKTIKSKSRSHIHVGNIIEQL